MIKIVNLKNYKPRKNETLIKVDRSNKVLGNRFIMKSEEDRDTVCDNYDKWFKEQIARKNNVLLNELRRIYKIALNEDIALGCWCYPKRCHASTIKEFLDSYLPKKEVDDVENQLMIVDGDILKVKSGILVHQVNNCGKMGAGLALSIKNMYPKHFEDYMSIYNNATKDDENSSKASSLLGRYIDTKIDNLIIRGVFTQDGYGRDKQYTNYDLLRICFRDLARTKTDAIYIPHGIGCGLAGGDWKIVSKIIYEEIPSAIIVKHK